MFPMHIRQPSQELKHDVLGFGLTQAIPSAIDGRNIGEKIAASTELKKNVT